MALLSVNVKLSSNCINYRQTSRFCPFPTHLYFKRIYLFCWKLSGCSMKCGRHEKCMKQPQNRFAKETKNVSFANFRLLRWPILPFDDDEVTAHVIKRAGPASAGPDLKDFRGALLVCKKFWGGATSHNRGNHEWREKTRPEKGNDKLKVSGSILPSFTSLAETFPVRISVTLNQSMSFYIQPPLRRGTTGQLAMY